MTKLNTNITYKLTSIENQIMSHMSPSHQFHYFLVTHLKITPKLPIFIIDHANALNSILTLLFHHRTRAAILLFPATVKDISTMNCCILQSPTGSNRLLIDSTGTLICLVKFTLQECNNQYFCFWLNSFLSMSTPWAHGWTPSEVQVDF